MKKSFLSLFIFGSVVFSFVSSSLAVVYVDNFDSLNSSFWTSKLHSSNKNAVDIVPLTDSNNNTTNCLRLTDCVSVSHKFDNVMYGRVSVKVYDISTSMGATIGLHTFNTNLTGLPGGSVEFGATQVCRPGYGFYITDYAHSPNDMDMAGFNRDCWAAETPNSQEYHFIEKSEGWHTFEAIYDRNFTTLFVDKQQIYSMPIGCGFDRISLDSDMMKYYYYDDFVLDASPNPVPVPEPSTFFFLGSGIIGFIFKKGISSKKYLEISKFFNYYIK